MTVRQQGKPGRAGEEAAQSARLNYDTTTAEINQFDAAPVPTSACTSIQAREQ